MIVGWAPHVALAVIAPGYVEANVEWIFETVSSGQTNLARPIPWPWRELPAGLPFSIGLSNRITGWGYLLAPVVCFGLGLRTLLTSGDLLARRPLVVATACVAPIYLHHAYSRADVAHLAQSIGPTLLGLVALTASLPPLRRVVLLFGMSIVSLAATHPHHPLAHYLLDRGHRVGWREVDAGGSQIRVSAHQAAYLERVRQVVDRHAGVDEAVLIAPLDPMLYPLLGQTCPIFNSYPILPASTAIQRRVLNDLTRKRVKLALIRDYDLDGRSDLRFSNAYPLVWAELQRSYRQLPDVETLPGITLFLATPAEPSSR
jgi:hypothetical protein